MLIHADANSFSGQCNGHTSKHITDFFRSWEGTEDVEVEEIVEKEGNAKGEGFMSSLAFITVKAKVRSESKSYEWVVKSTPREANRSFSW